MKNNFLPLNLFIACLLGFAALPAEESHRLGSEWARHVEHGFLQYRYCEILSKLETRFQAGVYNKEWESLKNDERKFYETYSSSNYYEHACRTKLKALRQDRNRALLVIAKKYPNEFVSKVIIDLQEESDEMAGEKTTVWTEFDFKITVFRSLVTMAASPEVTYNTWSGLGFLSAEEAEEYNLVINLYRQQMHPFSDQIFSPTQSAANQHNEAFLQALAKDARPPENQAEKETAEIMQAYNKRKIAVINTQ